MMGFFVMSSSLSVGEVGVVLVVVLCGGFGFLTKSWVSVFFTVSRKFWFGFGTEFSVSYDKSYELRDPSTNQPCCLLLPC